LELFDQQDMEERRPFLTIFHILLWERITQESLLAVLAGSI
jgi:hypothetical protein